ncbi:hypothetical protein KR054_000641, partial [Drosophila jambulina]
MDSFLTERHRTLETIDSIQPPTLRLSPSKQKKSIVAPRVLKSFSTRIVPMSRRCDLCSAENHPVRICPRFLQMTIENRTAYIQERRLCLNCFASGHPLRTCTSAHSCSTCYGRHHTLLHPSNSAPSVPIPLDASTQSSPPIQRISSFSTRVTTEPNSSNYWVPYDDRKSRHRVILATALVLVNDASGCYRIGRALLDSCSQVNVMSDEFAQALRMPRIKRHMESAVLENLKRKLSKARLLQSRFNALELSLDFCFTSHIAYIPDLDIDISSWHLPQNTPLADDKFNGSRRIDLRLGTETFFEILSVGQIKLDPPLPILLKTLGWIISGRCQTKPTIVHSYSITLEDAINRNVERLWKVEDVSKSADMYTPEQRKCEEKFADSVRRDNDGRIVVRLPFKTDPSMLGNSYETARRRFQALERRLSRPADLRSKYIEFMQEFETLGHMSLVEMPQLNAPHFYIPHHCVFKPTSTSTKLRVVFDASCQTTSQKSLNDLLMVGPTLQPDLYVLLLRFRTYRYVITADVVKMFRQVLVDVDDRKIQYILWRSNPLEPMRTYELNTVTYATATAPYLAVRSMTYLEDLYANKFKVGA